MDAAAFWNVVDRMRQSRRACALMIACIAATTLFLAHYRDYSIAYCAVCASERSKDEWGVGLGDRARLPLVSSEDVEPSEAFRDLCAADHPHDWRTDHTWHRSVIGGHCACGGWPRGPFALAYELSPDLRELVRREIASGSLDRATALRLVAVPQHGKGSERAAPGTLPDAALLATAERIFRTHYAGCGRNAEAEVRYRLRRMGG